MKYLKHVPGDYRYREVPGWATRAASGNEYREYCKWLAGHLLKQDFTLSNEQSAYAESLLDQTPEGIAITLADALGYLIWEKDILERQARQDTPYAEIEKRERKRWQENLTNDPEIDQSFEEIKTMPAEYAQIRREVDEMDRLGNVPDHADIPIRPLLALAVRKCRDTAHAQEVIQLFYDTFNETASK